MGGRGIWAIGTTLLCVSCSLLVSVDGLTGGAGTPGAPDGSTSPDASVAETAPLPDGALDAADAGTIARFCDDKQSALLCEDFDRTPLPGEFTGQESQGGRVRLVAAQPAVSGAFALEVILDPETSGSDRYANVNAARASGPSKITFDVSMRITKVPTTPVFVSAFAFEAADASKKGIYDVELAVGATASGATIALTEYFYATNTTGARTPATPVALNTWFSLRTKVDLPAKTAELFRNGASLGTITLAPPGAVTSPPQYSTLFLGAYSQGKHDGWTFQFDDAALFTP